MESLLWQNSLMEFQVRIFSKLHRCWRANFNWNSSLILSAFFMCIEICLDCAMIRKNGNLWRKLMNFKCIYPLGICVKLLSNLSLCSSKLGQIFTMKSFHKGWSNSTVTKISFTRTNPYQKVSTQAFFMYCYVVPPCNNKKIFFCFAGWLSFSSWNVSRVCRNFLTWMTFL